MSVTYVVTIKVTVRASLHQHRHTYRHHVIHSKTKIVTVVTAVTKKSFPVLNLIFSESMTPTNSQATLDEPRPAVAAPPAKRKAIPEATGPDGPAELVVLVDRREQRPLPVEQFLPTLPASLYTGDYSLQGAEDQFAVERKSIEDVVSSLSTGRDRFEHELLRLRSMRWKRLLIVGSHLEVEQHRYRSQMTPAAVLGSLAAFEARFDIPVVWQPDSEAAARLVARWAHYFFREQVRAFQRVKTCAIEPAVPTSTLQLAN